MPISVAPKMLSSTTSEPDAPKSRILLDDVVQRYRVIRERPDSLREAFTKLFRHPKPQEFEALRGISLHVSDGEVLGIIGRNGSGKSTVLKLIAGVYKPSAGKVQVRGSVAALIELGAGFHHDLTGRENIVLNGLLLGLTRKQILEREQKIIEFADIGEFIDSPVKQYSSGMFMRLAFAIAVEVDPDVLLVDEILSVGDAEFQEKCDRRMEEFRQARKTIVFVSHDLHAVRRLCTRVVLLDRGCIAADGRPAVVLENYNSMIHQST
jgi:ABC-type polysaccharide/polyol phosphate transport system ATPase subunit